MNNDFSSSEDRILAKGQKTTADWQRPAGVSAGTWDYIRGGGIASGYDEALHNDPLTLIDRSIINHCLPSVSNPSDSSPPIRPIVADLGCGTGRHAWQLAEAGYRVLAIDLSPGMLNELVKKNPDRQVAASYRSDERRYGPDHQDGQEDSGRTPSPFERIHPIQANLVQLAGFRTASLDHAICMFSTLGMIQGRANRMIFLKELRRLLKREGQLILHVHNLWYQSRHLGGTTWLLKSAWQSLLQKGEFGDRYADYRAVKNMFIHSFQRGELRRDLRDAGFRDLQWHGIAPLIHEAQNVSVWKTFQLVGWIVRAT